MSRVLARALGGPAGPDPVRPRLPTRFEPGLEMASAPELVAGQPEAGGGEDLELSGPAAGDRAGGVIGPAGWWSEPREPADPRAGSPLAGPGSGSPAVRPGPGQQPPGGPAPVLPAGQRGGSGGQGGRAGSGGLDGRAGSGGPGDGAGSGGGLARPQDADSRRRERSAPANPVRPAPAYPVRPAPAYPVRPAPAIPELAEPPAPAGSTAGSVAPAWPADQLPAAAMSTGPAVHITIGQVEIRADRAAGEPARPAARPGGRPRRVAPDLSEYLQRRGQRR